MIAWCAYCQRFQGERAPFDSFELTHGMCPECARRGVLLDPAAVRAARPVAEFFADLRRAARAGADLAAGDLLDRAGALGVGAADLLVGMVQPALCEIGELWARGEATVAIEHRFSTLVEALVAAVRERTPAPAPPEPGRVEFLLVDVEGNHHTLGIRILEVLLRAAGRSVTAVAPGLPAREVVALVRALRPAVVGVSVALLPQMRAVRELAAEIAAADLPSPPRLVVGGQPIKAGLQLAEPRGFELCGSFAELLAAGPSPAG